MSARMGGGKCYMKVRLNNLFIKKKNGTALVCIVLAAAILGGALVSCTGEVPENEPEGGWKAAAANFGKSAEVRGQLDRWNAVLESFDNPVDGIDGEQLEASRRQVEQKCRELESELMNLCAILELEESIEVTPLGLVSFTIPADYPGNDEWQIEIRGRAEYDGFGGMSLHYGFDRIELKPGMQCSYNFAEEWSGITDLYLSVTLGEQGKDIDLLAIASDKGNGAAVWVCPG